MKVFVKGSPEKIAELCKPESLPADYMKVLEAYTKKGFRVIALSYRTIEKYSYLRIQKLKRESIECDLTFLGFLVMENKLKAATISTITKLNECRIRTIMATGDNTLTAISVAKNCNILDKEHLVYYGEAENDQLVWKLSSGDDDDLEAAKPVSSTTMIPWQNESRPFGIALNGKALEYINSRREYMHELLEDVIKKASVYARMSPDDKALLVSLLQEIMKTNVGMCGDGANDCAALKQSDAGISLSEAEASIAAPFTSKVQDISCVITLIREGRAALTTTFQAFKFIELYSMI